MKDIKEDSNTNTTTIKIKSNQFLWVTTLLVQNLAKSRPSEYVYTEEENYPEEAPEDGKLLTVS